jgi:hypothetical protein
MSIQTFEKVEKTIVVKTIRKPSPITPHRPLTRIQSRMVRRSSAVAKSAANKVANGRVQKPKHVAKKNVNKKTPITPISSPSDSTLPSGSPEQVESTKESLGTTIVYERYEKAYVLSGHPADRDPSEVPLIAQNAEGERKTLWAKLDTGASMNVMEENVIRRLGRESEIESLRPMSDIEVRDICGKDVKLDRKIKLSVWAGHNNIAFKDVEFWVPRNNKDVNTDEDGVPDVLLGLPEILRQHMVTIDPEFAKDADPELEVIVKRSEDELTLHKVMPVCLGIKFPPPSKSRGRRG